MGTLQRIRTKEILENLWADEVAMQHDSEENTYAAEVLTLAVQVNCSQSHEILFSTFTSS
jgi:hypothetical protein